MNNRPDSLERSTPVAAAPWPTVGNTALRWNLLGFRLKPVLRTSVLECLLVQSSNRCLLLLLLILTSIAGGCRTAQPDRSRGVELFDPTQHAAYKPTASSDDDATPKDKLIQRSQSKSKLESPSIQQVGYVQDDEVNIPDAEPVAMDEFGDPLLDDADFETDEQDRIDKSSDEVDFERERTEDQVELNRADNNPVATSSAQTEARPADNVGSMEAIVEMAIAINPSIARAKAQLASLQGKRIQVGLPPNPTTGIVGDDINEGGSAGRYGVIYGNKIVRGDKLLLARQQVHAEIKAQRVLIDELRQRVVTDVRLRYFDLLIAIQKSDLAGQLVNLSRDGVEATEQLLNAKELARTSLLQAELELQQSMVVKRRAQNDVDNARRSLAGLIGEVDLPFDKFTGSLDEFSGPIDIELAFDRLVHESPEIAKLHASVEVARRDLAKQRAEQVVDLSWRTGLAYDTATNDVIANFQLSWPILKYNRNQGAICSARHEIVASERQVQRKAMQLRQQLVAAYRNYWDAKLQVDSIQDQILPKAKETLDLIVLGFREGEVSFLEMLTAQRTFFQFNLENINQQKILWQHRVAIEGLLLSKNFEVE